jgi:hypothetical protein
MMDTETHHELPALGALVLTTTLRIDNQTFFLEPGEDLTSVKKRLLAAVRSTGEFVVFTPAGRGKMSVLVTANTRVQTEEVTRVEEATDDAHGDIAALNQAFDYDGEYDGHTDR